MNEEKKEALLKEILKAIGAEPEDVREIDLRIKWEPSKAKDKPKQD